MNKETTSEMEDELRPEYDLAELLKGGVRGKYVARYRAGSNVVVLASELIPQQTHRKTWPIPRLMILLPHGEG